MRALTLSLPAALCFGLLACGEKSDDDDDDDGDGGAEDGGAFDGGAADGGSGDGGGGGGSSACSVLFPIDSVGTTWEWAYSSSGTTGTLTQTALGEEEYEGETAWAMADTWDLSGPDYDQVSSGKYWYRCDDEGVWALGWENTSTTTTPDYESTSETWGVYTTPGLIVPSSVAKGDTWVFDTEYVFGDATGELGSYADRYGYEVIGTEEVTVPAGTFDTWVISLEGNAPYYSAEDVGTVKTASTELVEVR